MHDLYGLNDTWTQEQGRVHRPHPLCAIFEPPYKSRPASGSLPVGSQVYSLASQGTARRSSATATNEKLPS